MDQPITITIARSSLDVSLTYPGVNQDVKKDPELDNIWYLDKFSLKLVEN